MRERRPPRESGKRGVPERSDATHAEAAWLARQVESGLSVRIRFRDGDELTGVLQWYDRTALRLGLSDGSHRIVQKATISYLWQDD